jgi:hypothetical protein
MTPERVAEAESRIEFAKSLGLANPRWAVETIEHRNDPPMTEEEAGEVMHRAVFDGFKDEGAYEEAKAVIAAAAPHHREFSDLAESIAKLAESKLGMAPWSASLHARSEALAARQASKTVEESVTNLRVRRDAIKGQAVTG